MGTPKLPPAGTDRHYDLEGAFRPETELLVSALHLKTLEADNHQIGPAYASGSSAHVRPSKVDFAQVRLHSFDLVVPSPKMLSGVLRTPPIRPTESTSLKMRRTAGLGRT
jgi:hypothetical protein